MGKIRRLMKTLPLSITPLSGYAVSMKTPIQSWSELGFGLFIHVGLYSILGGVYHGKPVTRGYSEQILSHGYVSQYDYEQLTAEFTFEAFDAKKIARVAQEAGMRYIVITTKHHDGFCLFHTKTTAYNSKNTPYGNDVVKELAEACKESGLGFGIYFSWIDWHYPHALPISAHNSDIITPLHQALNIAQLTELLTNYGPICELWMDMGAPSEEQSKEVSSLVKRLQPQCMINGRIWNDFQDFLTMGDNQIPTLPLNCPWQTPASIYKETWGYRSWQERGDLNEKIAELTETLRQVRLMGGNYLLNIGLTGDGSIVPFEENVLLGIGKNLQREPLSVERSTLPFLPLNVGIPSKGAVLYRYSGTHYYTYKPIPTTLRWSITVEEPRSYSLFWANETPIDSEQKVRVMVGRTVWHATLQKGQEAGVFSENLLLERGEYTIEVSTVGEPLTRPELRYPSLQLTIKE